MKNMKNKITKSSKHLSSQNVKLLDTKMVFKKVFIALLFLVVSALTTHAQNTYFVNDGSTSGDIFTTATGVDNPAGGASSAPFATIGYALTKVSSGDIIMIDAGTYNEIITVSTKVTLKGVGNQSIISAPTSCTGTGLYVGASGSQILDMKITNYEKGIVIDGAKNIELNRLEIVDNCYVGVVLGHQSNYFRIRNSKINNNGTLGFRASTSAQMKKIKIDSCEVKSNKIGIYIAAAASGNMFDTVQIRNSNFSNNTQKGMYFEKLSNAIIENNIMDNAGNDPAYGRNNGIDINLMFGTYSNILIQNNELTNCGALGTASNAEEPSAMVIKARDDASFNGYLSNVIIKNNLIRGPRNGLRLGATGVTNSTPTSVAITENSFGSSFANKAIVNRTSNSISAATCNWFGTINLASITALKTGSVTTTPFLVSGTDISSNIGFQPTTVTLSVNAGRDTSVYLGFYDANKSALLTAIATGGSGNYAYSWSPGGLTTQSITVTPAIQTTYTVTVTDINGCVTGASDAVKISVVNVACTLAGGAAGALVCKRSGTSPSYVFTTVCEKYRSVIQSLKLPGNYLGPCNSNKKSNYSPASISMELMIIPNPSTGYVNLILPDSKIEQNIRIINSVGQSVYESSTKLSEHSMDLTSLSKGVYYIQVSSEDGSATKKLVLD